VLISLYDHDENISNVFLVLAGSFTGLAIWTKNEGWLFLFCLILARTVAALLSRPGIQLKHEILPFFSGLIPFLIFILFHKFAFAPKNDLFASLGQETVQKLLDPERYVNVASEFLLQIVRLEPRYSTPFVLFPFLGVLWGIQRNAFRRPSVLTGLLTLFLILGGYAVVFITTPHPLEWHLFTAVPRLFLQVWPSAIFILILMLSPHSKVLENNPLNRT
jgi:hypothetical protein